MGLPIPQQMDNDYVRNVVMSYVKPGLTFDIPQGDNIIHLVGVSGGADSAVTAIIFKAFYPSTPVTFLMTDTGEEAKGTMETLELLGQVTGTPVTIIEPEQKLYDYINDVGMFLPSARARYCTSRFKISPYNAYIERLKETCGENLRIASYVGLRADEPTRMGASFSDDTIQNHFPLRELGLTKRDVFNILERTIGIPEFYRFRSRSGCSTCCFGRRSEAIALSVRDLRAYMRAAQLEKLPDHVIDTLMELPKPLSLELGIGRNHMIYPKPPKLFAHPEDDATPVSPKEISRTGLKKVKENDLFGHDNRKSIFVAVHAVRYWCWDRYQLSNEHIVVYSTSLAGLKKALKFYFLHLLNTRELQGCRTEDDVRDEHKIIMYEVALENPEQLFGLDLENAFTWQSDRQPMLLIRKVVAILDNILLADEINHHQRSGEVLWMGTYEPAFEAELERDFDIEDEITACYVCSR